MSFDFIFFWCGQDKLQFICNVLMKKFSITLTKLTRIFFIHMLLKKQLYHALNKKKMSINKCFSGYDLWQEFYKQCFSFPNNSFQAPFFFLKNYVMSLILCQKNSQDMNLTSHTWWEPGKDSENAVYFRTKGHRINSPSQHLKLAGQRALDVWKINVRMFKMYLCIHL